jgi:hypothetical protein
MCSFAISKSSIFGMKVNPCAGVERFGRREGTKPRRQYWAWEHEEVFVAHARHADHEVHKGYLLLA